jgi:prepilin-type N-terminal cleavage/methylation domain-containing protein
MAGRGVLTARRPVTWLWTRCSALGTARRSSCAFTLIEIMVAVGIIAILLAIAIPSVYQGMNKEPMRKATEDLKEACSQARARAILNGVPTEVRIRPSDRLVRAIESSAPADSTPGTTSHEFEGDQFVTKTEGGGGGEIFSAKLSDEILIDYIEVNAQFDLQQLEEVTCMFYPNGTADMMALVLRSERGEVRKFMLDLVTGILDYTIEREANR